MTTKEKILEEAFLLFSQTRNSPVSLNDIAKQVGISKTAIFSHYKNKEALLTALEDKLLDELANCLSPLKNFDCEEGVKESVRILISFILEKPEYFGFFCNMKIYEKCPDLQFFKKLAQRNVKLFGDPSLLDNNIDKLYSKGFFFGVTIIYFLVARKTFIKNGTEIPSDDDFKESIANLVCYGLRQKTELTEERKDKLAQMAIIEKSELNEENQFFVAFSRVLLNEGYSGVTVEKIAKELGMAKSSLYFYFENKNEMIKDLIRDEMIKMIGLIAKKCNSVHTPQEKVFIFFKSALSYFTQKPEINRIISWLVYKNKLSHEDMGTNPDFSFRADILPKEFNPGLPASINLFVGWLFALVSITTSYGKPIEIGEQNIENCVLNINGYIQFGVIKDLIGESDEE